MKRLNRIPFLLFALPFIVLAVVTLRPSATLTLETDGRLFAQQVAGQISVGMAVPQAQEILKRNGFSSGAMPSEIARGKILPPSPIKLGFVKTQRAFPRFWDQHVWRVGTVVQDNRIQEIQTGVE
ncbi:hypothetical protein EON83_12700 [bacterium]|nr:MAG: hypothetical protein EON83_12700 [bacterium]